MLVMSRARLRTRLFTTAANGAGAALQSEKRSEEGQGGRGGPVQRGADPRAWKCYGATCGEGTGGGVSDGRGEHRSS